MAFPAMEDPRPLPALVIRSPLQWMERSDSLMFLAEEKGRVRLCLMPELFGERAVEVEILTPGDVVVEAFYAERVNAPARSRDFAAIIATPERFPVRRYIAHFPQDQK